MQDYLKFQPRLESPDEVSTYDELPLWSAMAGLLLLKHLPLGRSLTALDLGCGTGFPLLELAQRLGVNSHVYGLDPWSSALQRARQKAQAWVVPNITLVDGIAEAMPFPNSLFDLVVSNLGLNNFNDVLSVLKECNRVMKTGASLALTTNLQGHMAEFYAVFRAILEESGAPEALNRLEEHIRQRASLPGVLSLLENAGFQVAKVQREPMTMRFSDGSALLRHYFIKLGFLDGWKGVLSADEQARTFARLEEQLNLLASEAEGLQLSIPMAYFEARKY